MDSRLIAFLGLLVCVLLGAAWHSSRPGPVAPVASSVGVQQDPGDTTPLPLAPSGTAVDELTLTSTEAEMRQEIDETEQESSPEQAEEGGLLRGRVLSNALGTPLVDARVEITYRLHSEYSNLDLTQSRSSRPVAEATTDVEGWFEVPVPEAVPLDLVVAARGHATARRGYVFAGDDLLLRLTPAAILEGVLTMASDDSPVEGALVRGWDGKRVEQFRAPTGPGGTFLFDDLQPGIITIAITPSSAAAPSWKKVELRAGERTRLDLALDPGVRIHGTVTDQEGRPIPRAEVGAGWTFRKSVFADALGNYELRGFGGPGVYDIHVRAAGFGGDQHEYPYDAMPSEDTRLDFVLAPAASATGRVVEAGGEPLEGVYVAGVASEHVGGEQRTDWESAHTGPDGRFELTSLEAGLGHQLLLRKEGFGTRVYDFPADEAQHNRIDLGEFVLVPGAIITGTLRTKAGTPIPDYTVKLRGANADTKRLRPDTDKTNATWYTTVRESRTDSTGRFRFADVAGGEFELTASVRGKSNLAASIKTVVPEGGRIKDIELTLDLGTPTNGVVLKPDGTPAVGVSVGLIASEEQARFNAVSGTGGRFELLGMSEDLGEVFIVTSLSSYNWYNPDARLAASPPVAAQVGDTDITVTLRDLAILEGTVEDTAGQPVVGVFVTAYASGVPRWSESELASTQTGELGAFRMELPAGGTVDLETGTLQREIGTDTFVRISDVPVRLDSVATDARNVLLQLP